MVCVSISLSNTNIFDYCKIHTVAHLPKIIAYWYRWYMATFFFSFDGFYWEVIHAKIIQLGELPPFSFSITVIIVSAPSFPFIFHFSSFESDWIPLFDKIHLCGRNLCAEVVVLLMLSWDGKDNHCRFCCVVGPSTSKLWFLFCNWRVRRSTDLSEALPTRVGAAIWAAWLLVRIILDVATDWVVVGWTSL